MTPSTAPRPAALPWFLQLPFLGLALVIGLGYRFGDPAITDTPSFDPARAIRPIATWGDVFLLGALVMTIGLLHPRVQVYTFMIGGGIYILWGIFFAGAALSVPLASLSAWATYGFIGFCHYLAAWRIHIDERTR